MMNNNDKVNELSDDDLKKLSNDDLEQLIAQIDQEIHKRLNAWFDDDLNVRC